MLDLHACELLHALQYSGHSTFIRSTGIVKFEGSALDGGHGHFHYQCLGQELTGRGIHLLSKVHQHSHTSMLILRFGGATTPQSIN